MVCRVILGAQCLSVPLAAQQPDTHAQAPAAIDLRRGVAVVAVDDQSMKAAWELATRVYRDPMLLPPGLDDATARVLAGEPPVSDAPARLTEIDAVRRSLHLGEPATVRWVASLASELGVSALLLVHVVAPEHPRARLFVAQNRVFFSPELWPAPNAEHRPSWESAVAWLHAHAQAREQPRQPPGEKPRLLVSPWLWGAVGAALGVGLVVYAASRDTGSDSIHLQGRIGP